MEDLSALAARLAASVGDVRGCLIVSRDGLVIGAHPVDGEAKLKSAWLRFAALGEPDRSFVQFGDEIWCYVRRGAYAAFLVTSVGVRPGLAIDQIEQALLTAEEARSKRESLKAPEAPAAPSGKPRTPLHAEPSRIDDPVLIRSEPAAVPTAGSSAVQPSQSPVSSPTSASDIAAEPEVATPVASGPSDADPDASDTPPAPRDPSKGGIWARRKDDVREDGREDEIDRVLLAREFSQLLQEDENGADG
jgi:hypothetical protein